MRKFFAGVLVGWVCSDIITQGIREFLDFADGKVDEKIAEKQAGKNEAEKVPTEPSPEQS